MTKKAILFIMAVGLLLWVQGVSAEEGDVDSQKGRKQKQTVNARIKTRDNQRVKQSRKKRIQRRNNRKDSQKQLVKQKRERQSNPDAIGMKQRAGNKAALMKPRGFHGRNLKKGYQNRNRKRIGNLARQTDRFPKRMQRWRQKGSRLRMGSRKRLCRGGNWQQGKPQRRMSRQRHKRMRQPAGKGCQFRCRRGKARQRMGGKRFGRMHPAGWKPMPRSPRGRARRGRRR